MVYHDSFAFAASEVHGSKGHIQHILLILAGVAVAAGIFNFRDKIFPSNSSSTEQDKWSDRLHWVVYFFQTIIVAIFAYVMMPSLLKSMSLLSVPLTSWAYGELSQKPTFYFAQLIEFSIFYLFAFVGIISPSDGRSKTILSLTSVMLLLFFILWGNNQSRYIAPIIPFLIILSVVEIQKVMGAIGRIKSSAWRVIILSLFSFFLLDGLFTKSILLTC